MDRAHIPQLGRALALASALVLASACGEPSPPDEATSAQEPIINGVQVGSHANGVVALYDGLNFACSGVKIPGTAWILSAQGIVLGGNTNGGTTLPTFVELVSVGAGTPWSPWIDLVTRFL